MWQHGKKAFDQRDVAPEPLFKWVHEEVLARPSFRTFIALLDNYSADIGVTEEVTSQELKGSRSVIVATDLYY